ncbi:hypothetical protein MN116_001233 [Schistosoma mekongi]|uniref:G-protein coupled receptors family 1 profile domain-containing protein n=1 Tax=Schistosoma mekongi TaxID=38744 RepID=A0AAE1ZM47_SCHME|nr:hypothetical protein MN116_001233 [Schistosoma mekongi]
MKSYLFWLIWLFAGFVGGNNVTNQHRINASSVVTAPYIYSSRTNSVSSASPCLQGFKSDELNLFLVFARIVTPVVFGMILIIGFVGNLLVMIVVLANAQMRNTTNILIFSLAVADMAFIVICVPSAAIVYVTGKWPLGLSLCRIYYYSSYVSVYCSVYTLVLMSLDRFMAVVYPIQCIHIRTQRNTTIAVIITWTVVLITNVPLFVNAILVKGPPEGGESSCVTEYCTYSWLVNFDSQTNMARDNRHGGQMFFLLFFLFGYLFPFVIICLLYICLILRLRCGPSSKMAHSAEALRSKKRVTHLVVTVVIVFSISWLPIHTIFLIQYYAKDPETDLFRIIQILGNCLAYGNSSINPILYTFLSEKFRTAFLKLICNRKSNSRVGRLKQKSFDNETGT